MSLIDSHCHLDRIKPDDAINGYANLDTLIEQTHQADISHMLNICVDKKSWQSVTAIAERHPNIFCAVGIHPESTDTSNFHADDLRHIAMHPKAIAIGETGLDYFHKNIPKFDQKSSFRTHIQIAIDLQMPLVVHTRDARSDTIDTLQSESAEKAGGVLHCFTETLDMAQQAMELNFYISFSGIVTFKNAKELHQVAKNIPLERILIETDAPYLAPVPHRGKQNEPKLVSYVAQAIADIKEISINEVAEATTANFFNLFDKSLTTKGLI